MDSTKKCLMCDKEFTPRNNGGKPQIYCSTACKNAAKKPNDDMCKRRYEQEHKEEIAEKRRARQSSPEHLAKCRDRYANDPEYKARISRHVRAFEIRKTLGIEIEEYQQRREEQRLAGDLCALCKQPLENDRVVLDHDHGTMKIREFLHNNCNRGIGMLQDSSAICRLAAEYLERHGK